MDIRQGFTFVSRQTDVCLYQIYTWKYKLEMCRRRKGSGIFYFMKTVSFAPGALPVIV